VINERNILKNIKSSNIIGMKSAWADKQYYYFLFDYALNGDLSSFLKKNGKYFFHSKSNKKFNIKRFSKSNHIRVLFRELTLKTV
jgi:hypothetical protein